MIEIFDYDTVRYPFREWAQDVLDSRNLASLHEHPCAGARIAGHRAYRFINALKNAYTDEVSALFARFAREYAVPRVTFPVWDRIHPNFRVHEKNTTPTSIMHRDRDYLSERGSMKIWLPFTDVAGGSSLWIETTEGANDLRPYDMRYGQALFFDSLNLLHGCQFNDTQRSRVSTDFIVRKNPCN